MKPKWAEKVWVVWWRFGGFGGSVPTRMRSVRPSGKAAIRVQTGTDSRLKTSSRAPFFLGMAMIAPTEVLQGGPGRNDCCLTRNKKLLV